MKTFKEYLLEKRKIYYHGTSQKFDQFDENKINWFVEDPKFAESYSYTEPSADGPNIRPVYLTFNSTFDANQLTKGDNSIAYLAMSLYSQSKIKIDNDKARKFINDINAELLIKNYKFKPQDFWYRNSKIITPKGNRLIFEMIKFFGFDSIKLIEDDHETIGILYPENIKPAFIKESLLYEMPVAIPGDYVTSTAGTLSFIDKEYLEEFNFKSINKINKYDLYYSDETNTADHTYILLDDKKPVLYFTFDDSSFLDFKNVKEILYIGISEQYRNKGLSKMIYLYFVEKGFVLISDAEQYDGSRRLWRSLSNSNNVDFIDIKKKEVVEKNIKISDINHNRYWSDETKRFLLRK